MDRHEQGLAKLRAGACEDGEEIAEGLTGVTRDNCLERDPLSFVRALVDDDLAFAVSIFDLARPLVEGRPVQPHERGIIEMAFDDVADKGRLTIAIGAGKIELTAAVDLAIAIVVSFAFEQPLIGHFNTSLSTIFVDL
jgi:hypothetical protein